MLGRRIETIKCMRIYDLCLSKENTKDQIRQVSHSEAVQVKPSIRLSNFFQDDNLQFENLVCQERQQTVITAAGTYTAVPTDVIVNFTSFCQPWCSTKSERPES
ncbi:hypothetical protein RRG08_054205 [Elysia crispata]|uniref:Uncharacterized protein n=1 Tax=Elysia crispata TaxID=231223 RepID=A0AAE0YBQ0_9GAST|nr:hypothetical protein RRG08_054205 [Elysia crispata]